MAFCEAIVKPMAWEEPSPQARARGQAIRSLGAETLVLGQDTFIRQAFTGGGALTPVSDHDMNTYLAPDSRYPILAWAHQMPLGGEPAGIVARIEAYDPWLAASSGIPKLVMPLRRLTHPAHHPSQMAGWCAASIAALDIVPCGTAGHHAPLPVLAVPARKAAG